MAGKIITVSDLDVFEEDLPLSELTYVNDDNFPFKYTINRKYSNSNKNVYICSDKKLDFALGTYNSTYEQIYANADNARAKILNSNVDANNNVVVSITSKKTLIALIAKDTDAKIRNSLTGVNLQISKSNNWLGQSTIPISFDYSISTDLDINYKIVENIDDISKEFECVGPNNYSIDLVNIWDTLKFGRHSISIDVYIQETLKCNITHIFEKMKEPITTLPTTASLKQAIVYNKEIEKEIDYQLFRFEEVLKEKGIEVLPFEKKMSSLIDKVSNNIGKKWASGTVTSSSATIQYISANGTTTNNKHYSTAINNLSFAPSVVIVYGRFTTSSSSAKINVVSVYCKSFNNYAITMQVANEYSSANTYALPVLLDMVESEAILEDGVVMPVYGKNTNFASKTYNWIAFE